MPVPVVAETLVGRLLSEAERAAANHLGQLIAAQRASDVRLRLLDAEEKPVEVTLTPGFANLLLALLSHIGRGDAVTLVPVNQMLTIHQAAGILNVSQPFLISLLDKGEIEQTKVGRHRRIKAEDVFAYKHAQVDRRSDALGELAQQDAELL